MEPNQNPSDNTNQNGNEASSSNLPDFIAQQPLPEPQSKPKWRKWLLLTLLLSIAIVAVIFALKQVNKPIETAAPSNAKKDIKLIRYGLDYSSADRFYPNSQLVDAEILINAQIFEPLVRYDDSTKITPALATGWSNPDSSTWLFDIKKNVTFHTGRTLTAKDVKFSLDYVIDNNPDIAEVYVSSITQVDVVDDYKIKITTDGPDPTLLNKLTFLHIIDSKADIGDPSAGSGPYVVKPGTKPDEKALQLVAYNKYHDGHIYTRALNFQALSIEDQIAAFKAGTVDIIGALSQKEFNQLAKAEKFKAQNYGVFYVGLNSLREDSPLQSKQFRQALRSAIDIPTLLKNSGIDGTIATQMVPSSIPGYDRDIQAAQYNPTKAKQLLTEAGFGTDVSLELVHGSNRTAVANELKRQLANVGVNLKTQVDDSDAFFDVVLDGQTDMFLIEYGSDTLDGADVFKSTLQQTENYSNPEIDELLEQSDMTLDQQERLRVLQRVSKLVVDDVATLPLVTVNDLYALRQPYIVKQSMQTAQIGTYFWQVYQE